MNQTGPQYDPQPGDTQTWTGNVVFDRPVAEAPAPAPTGPRFDPQPGDTMTFHYCDAPANVRTVKARDGDNVDFEVCWLRGDRRTYTGSMDLEDWQDDGDGGYTYARPEAPKVRTAEDARTDPQPGDTMTYAHYWGHIYTVTSTDADSVTCTVRLPRTNWSDAWDGEWVYAPGTGHVPCRAVMSPAQVAEAPAPGRPA